MRRLAYPAAVLLLLASTSTAYAGAGPPKLAEFDTGSYQATVYNDSHIAQLGSNMVTVEIHGLPPGAHASLKLVSPKGQTVSVPLNPLTVLSGSEGHGGSEDAGHGAESDGHGTTAAPKADDHGTKTDAHGTKADAHGAAEADAHDTESTDGAGFNARGRVRLDQIGEWTAILEIDGVPEGKLTARAPFTVERGGPNQIFLSVAGLLMGGTMIYGAINRRSIAEKGR